MNQSQSQRDDINNPNQEPYYNDNPHNGQQIVQRIAYMVGFNTKREQPFFDNNEINQDELDYKHKAEQSKDISNKKSKSELALMFILNTIMEVFYMFATIPYSFCQLFYYFYLMIKGESNFLAHFIDPIIVIFFSSVKCYIIFEYIFYFNSDSIDQLWIMNAFYLSVTLVLVTSYIKCIKNQDQSFLVFLSYNKFLSKSTLSNKYIQIIPEDSNDIFDIQNNILNWKEEYKRVIEFYEVDLTSQRFNTFFTTKLNPTNYEFRGFQLFLDMNQQLQPLKYQYLALLSVAIIKIALTMLYLYLNKAFNLKEFINIIVIIIFYVNFTYSLNRLLSNYDLRRKKILLKNMNGMLKVSGEAINYFEKLDIASAISIETWDNSRRCIYDFFRSEQTKLEACYICLFIYYIFVSLVLISFYADIFIFFSKESIHLRPLMIIQYSMDFILFSIILLIRIYSGESYNKTFEKSQNRISNAMGITQDLIQMYDYYFLKQYIKNNSLLKVIENCKKFIDMFENYQQPISSVQEYQQESQIQQQIQKISSVPNNYEMNKNDYEDDESDRISTIYDILVGKIKYNTDYYIKNKIEFLGQRFEQSRESKFHLKMLNNMLSSYKRINMQIKADSNTQQYLFLNYFPLTFEQTLITICLGLGTVIPSILTKFMDIFVVS